MFLILTSRQSIDSIGHIVIFKLVIQWVYLEFDFVYFPFCITAFEEWVRDSSSPLTVWSLCLKYIGIFEGTHFDRDFYDFHFNDVTAAFEK